MDQQIIISKQIFQNSTKNKQRSLSDQIQPFQVQPNKLTHQQIQRQVQKWDTYARIQQKFSIWQFSFPIQKISNLVSQPFYKTAIYYVFMKKLFILIKDFNQQILIQKSKELKDIYKQFSIKKLLKGKKFDYLLLTTVKLIGFFLGSHTRQIIIDKHLEAQIYTILIYVLLGTEVGQKTYSVVEQKYKKKPVLQNNNRNSILGKIKLSNVQKKKNSLLIQKSKKSTIIKKRIGRCECRTGTALFHQIPQNQQDKSYLLMKQLIKTNLFVKQFVPKPKPKQTFDEVLSKINKDEINLKQLNQVVQLQKRQMKHKKIFYTQMSSSLDLKRDNETLNILKNHSVKFRPEKKSKYYKMISRQDLKIKLPFKENQQQNKLPKINLQEPQVYSYQAMVCKKKQGSYWKKIISQMKQNKFQNIEHFPPISAKMYFKNGQFDDENRKSKDFENNPSNVWKQKKDLNEIDQNENAEFITQKIESTNRSQKSSKASSPQKQKTYAGKKQKIAKTTLRTKTLLQQIKNQINIIEYSTILNENEIYKQERRFEKIYSNQPIEGLNTKIKKQSSHYLKEVSKKFKEECKVRQNLIERQEYSLPQIYLNNTTSSRRLSIKRV